MIYLALHNENQMLSVPRAAELAVEPGAMSLSLRKGGQTVVFEGLQDAGVNSMFYVFELQGVAQRLVTGEYDYELMDAAGATVSIGILTAGEYVREVKDVPGGHEIVEYDG